MKNKKLTSTVIALVFLLSFIPVNTYARPCIGSEEQIITSDSSGCVVTTRITYSYIFWIKVAQSEEVISIVC